MRYRRTQIRWGRYIEVELGMMSEKEEIERFLHIQQPR